MKKTRHKNGLVIGWDEVFFLYNHAAPMQASYRAYVEAEGYYFKQYSPASIRVLTPAQQLLWVPSRSDASKYVICPYSRQWLEANVGECGPEWYVRPEPFDLLFHSVLFRLRRDALRFVHYLNDQLVIDPDP